MFFFKFGTVQSTQLWERDDSFKIYVNKGYKYKYLAQTTAVKTQSKADNRTGGLNGDVMHFNCYILYLSLIWQRFIIMIIKNNEKLRYSFSGEASEWDLRSRTPHVSRSTTTAYYVILS